MGRAKSRQVPLESWLNHLTWFGDVNEGPKKHRVESPITSLSSL